LNNINDKTIEQYIILEALGSTWRDVRVGGEFFGIRYSRRFNHTEQNGNSLYFNDKIGIKDTVR